MALLFKESEVQGSSGDSFPTVHTHIGTILAVYREQCLELPTIVFQTKRDTRDMVVIMQLPSTCEALGLIPRTAGKKDKPEG